MTKEEIKAHLISALYTFLTGVAIVVIPELNNLSLAEIKDGALIGLLLAGARLGVKMVGELLIAKFPKRG